MHDCFAYLTKHPYPRLHHSKESLREHQTPNCLQPAAHKKLLRAPARHNRQNTPPSTNLPDSKHDHSRQRDPLHIRRPAMTPAQLHKHVQERYQILDRLGHGIMGTVYRAIDKTDRSEVAIKVVLRNNLRDKSEHTALTREIQVLRQLDHPNIVSFRRAFEDDTAVYIVTEYCSGGDLFNYLNVSETALPEREALLILRQLLHAMDFLRKKGISHRDIKPENILMCEKGKIKLADLGLCFFRSPNGSRATRRRCGTLQYTAPEVLYHSSYEPERSDMWSSGVVLYAMLTQRLPYRYNDCARLKHELRKIDTDAILQSRRLYHLSGECLILLGSLLQLNPAKRPNPMKAVQLVDNALLGPLQTRSRHMPW